MGIPGYVSRAAMARKPRHGTPCNNCGACCQATLCPLASHLFDRVAGPCPALRVDPVSGDSRCGLVEEAAKQSIELSQAAMLVIGVGLGCDARFNGEPRDEAFAARCVSYDNQPAVIAARKLWEMK